MVPAGKEPKSQLWFSENHKIHSRNLAYSPSVPKAIVVQREKPEEGPRIRHYSNPEQNAFFSFKYIPEEEINRAVKKVQREKKKKEEKREWEKFIAGREGKYETSEKWQHHSRGSCSAEDMPNPPTEPQTSEWHNYGFSILEPIAEEGSQISVLTKNDTSSSYRRDGGDMPSFRATSKKVLAGFVGNVYTRRIKVARTKIESLIGEIRALTFQIPQAADILDFKRRKTRAAEFATRFERNYLYQLRRQVNALEHHILRSFSLDSKCSFQLLMCQKLATAHQTVCEALQLYSKHIPNSVQGGIPEKLSNLLKLLIQLTEISSKVGLFQVIAEYEDEIAPQCRSFMEVLHKIGEEEKPAEDRPPSSGRPRKKNFTGNEGWKTRLQRTVSVYSAPSVLGASGGRVEHKAFVNKQASTPGMISELARERFGSPPGTGLPRCKSASADRRDRLYMGRSNRSHPMQVGLRSRPRQVVYSQSFLPKSPQRKMEPDQQSTSDRSNIGTTDDGVQSDSDIVPKDIISVQVEPKIASSGLTSSVVSDTRQKFMPRSVFTETAPKVDLEKDQASWRKHRVKGSHKSTQLKQTSVGYVTIPQEVISIQEHQDSQDTSSASVTSETTRNNRDHGDNVLETINVREISNKLADAAREVINTKLDPLLDEIRKIMSLDNDKKTRVPEDKEDKSDISSKVTAQELKTLLRQIHAIAAQNSESNQVLNNATKCSIPVPIVVHRRSPRNCSYTSTTSSESMLNARKCQAETERNASNISVESDGRTTFGDNVGLGGTSKADQHGITLCDPLTVVRSHSGASKSAIVEERRTSTRKKHDKTSSPLQQKHQARATPLTLHLSSMEASSILEGQKRFLHHTKRNPLYRNVKNKPWNIIGRVADKLIEEIVQDIAKEADDNMVVKKLYDLEFQ